MRFKVNKAKPPLPLRTMKKMNKEVRKSNATVYVTKPVKSDQLTPKKVLSKYPAKIAAKNSQQLRSMEKNEKISKNKLKSPYNQSKRTSPNEMIDRTSAPRSTHSEGKRWLQTGESQILANNKVFRRKTAKTHPMGRGSKQLKGK